MGNKVESTGLTKPKKLEKPPEPEINQALHEFYYKTVNPVFCEVINHKITGKPLDLEGVGKKKLAS